MKPYNGHKSYDYWNVALWIGNDEGLYNLARECKRGRNLGDAARMMLDALPARTPDGVIYTVTNVREAIREL